MKLCRLYLAVSVQHHDCASRHGTTKIIPTQGWFRTLGEDMSNEVDAANDVVLQWELQAQRANKLDLNDYVVARVHRGKTTLHELRCPAEERAHQMRDLFGIDVAQHTTWAVGQVVGNQLFLCGRSDAAKNAIRTTHPELRVVS